MFPIIQALMAAKSLKDNRKGENSQAQDQNKMQGALNMLGSFYGGGGGQDASGGALNMLGNLGLSHAEPDQEPDNDMDDEVSKARGIASGMGWKPKTY